jgi:hypothetical protein
MMNKNWEIKIYQFVQVLENIFLKLKRQVFYFSIYLFIFFIFSDGHVDAGGNRPRRRRRRKSSRSEKQTIT